MLAARERQAAQCLVAAAVAVGAMLAWPARTAAETGLPGAAFGETSPVGALFTLTAQGRLKTHFCTASVVDSPAGDLLVTAAHCVSRGLARQIAFVPDYADGRSPYGVWTVTQVIMDDDWAQSADPDDDFAFLIVTRPGSPATLQALTGGEAVAIGEPAGQKIEVVGYPDDRDAEISCESTALAFGTTQFQLDCGGFTVGTSGSPFLADLGTGHGLAAVVGVLGGYEHGGTSASVSYAARFNGQLGSLYQTAVAASEDM